MADIIERVYALTDIAEEVEDLNRQIDSLRENCKLLANDLSGDDTSSIIELKVKDVKSVNDRLSSIPEEPEVVTAEELPGILKGLFSQRVENKEYSVHHEHTNVLELDLNPSETLRISAVLLEILVSKRDKLLSQLVKGFSA